MDDPVEATAIHFGGGLWSLWAVPIFAHGGFWNDIINRDKLTKLIHVIYQNRRNQLELCAYNYFNEFHFYLIHSMILFMNACIPKWNEIILIDCQLKLY